MSNAAIGVFGGSFDPVHFGHLRTAWELQQLLRLRELRMLPCGNPVFKPALAASGEQRVAMLNAAIADYPDFVVDTRELQRDGPSYTVETLSELRSELPDAPLCLIIGMDAWLTFAQWHRWQDILELGHIIVAQRPGSSEEPSAEIAELMRSRQTTNVADLHATQAGKVFVHEVTQLEISSSAIRQLVADGLGVDFLVPAAVQQLIINSDCYAKSTE